MMKRYIFLIVCLLFVSSAFAQYNQDGRRIFPGTIDATQFTEATRVDWFPVTADDSSGGAWTLDATNPPAMELVGTAGTAQLWTLGFDADGGSTGDDIAYLHFVCPLDYEAGSFDLDLYWFHLDDNGATTDGVTWDATANAVAEGEDIFVAGTGITAVEEICAQSDSALYITSLDIEVETITPGDHVIIKLWADESASELDSGELAHLLGAQLRWEAKDTY